MIDNSISHYKILILYGRLVVAFAFLAFSVHAKGEEPRRVATAQELQEVFLNPVDSVDVQLLPGEYHLTPMQIIDSTCGNCQDPNTLVNFTVGLHIRGRYVAISGPADQSAAIYTHAGYGLFIDRCAHALVQNITITGGTRDTNGNATDAAIVVKNSSAIIRNNYIHNNIGDSAIVARTVVGIMGITGREHSRITVSGNRIIRNSWDGIALYRDAEADVQHNVIDGVDKATGQRVGGGRGVGIGVTWNAKATVTRNLVKRYWKGIGLFVDAQGSIQENVVEDVVTWGISLWDADKGKPIGFINDNVICNTGACGAMIVSSTVTAKPGHFMRNVLTLTAQNPKYDSPDYYCYQCALALHNVPKGFPIEQNVFYKNRRATPDLPDNDIPETQFLKAIEKYCEWLSADTLFQNSDFVRQFCTGSK
jgi:hypothetical protein